MAKIAFVRNNWNYENVRYRFYLKIGNREEKDYYGFF